MIFSDHKYLSLPLPRSTVVLAAVALSTLPWNFFFPLLLREIYFVNCHGHKKRWKGRAKRWKKKWNQAEWRTWDLKAFPRRLIKSASTLCLWSSPSFRSSVDYIKFRKQSAATFRGNKHLRIRFNAAATSYIKPPNQSRSAINFR